MASHDIFLYDFKRMPFRIACVEANEQRMKTCSRIELRPFGKKRQPLSFRHYEHLYVQMNRTHFVSHGNKV